MAMTGTITASGLNVRSGPSTSYAIIGLFYRGDTVTISETSGSGSNKWGKTTINGKTGWIFMGYVNITDTGSTGTTSTSPSGSSDDTIEEDTDLGITDQEIQAELERYRQSAVNEGRAYKGSMRLFGLPPQFPNYQDFPVENVNTVLGRTFLNNMVLDAPILTLIPGKPSYLPGSKDKVSTSQSLIAGANESFGELNALGKNLTEANMRYYDFQQDYLTYIKYVNVLCRVAASFLELQDFELDGTKLSRYDWKNYRFTASSYTSMSGTALTSGVDAITSTVDKLKQYGKDAINTIFGFSSGDAMKDAYMESYQTVDEDGNPKEATDEEKEAAYNNFVKNYSSSNSILFDDQDDVDENLIASLDNALLNMNFVQFYIDPASGFSESADNTTTESKLQSALDSGGDLMKEIAFLTNSAGISDTEVAENASTMFDNMTTSLINSTSGAGSLGNVMSRIISAGTYVVKGENMIFPEIYQRSDYGRNYTISINLKSIYGNRYSIYMDTIVPLMHLLALVIPKQGSANTYSSPFLIRAHLPGVFNCNLGIVQSMSIEKNPSGDALSIDGLPMEYRVSLSVKDLYSDLMMTPSNEPLLFITNASLVDYLAVTCGLDVTSPQLEKKIQMYTDAIVGSIQDVPSNAWGILTNALDSFIISKVAIS